MAQQVLKRDSSVQPFDAEKIKSSIRKAALQAGLAEDKINEIIGQVIAVVMPQFDTKEQVSFSEIRQAVFDALQGIAPSVIESWKTHERDVKGLTTE